MTETVFPDEKRIVTRERLRILAIGHYIYGGMGLLMLPFFVPFFFVMAGLSFIPEAEWSKPSPTPSPTQSYSFTSPTPSPTPAQGAPPPIVFKIFAAAIGVFMVGYLTLSALTAYAGRCIQKRKHKIFIYIIAAINCIFFPYGTLLGVCTLLVLSSVEDAAEFKAAAASV